MNCNKCGRDNRSDAVFCDACGMRLGSEAASNGATGPLVGLRVLDWTMWQFGPVATMMLADLGAEVIKVESLDGDHARQFHRVSGAATMLPGGLNAYFESLNRQKKSIALDLKNPKGVKALYELTKKSDIFVQNFRKGVAERLGVGYEDLQKQNPRIIYGAGTGYGPNGPDSGKPAFAYTGEARSGSLWAAGNRVPLLRYRAPRSTCASSTLSQRTRLATSGPTVPCDGPWSPNAQPKRLLRRWLLTGLPPWPPIPPEPPCAEPPAAEPPCAEPPAAEPPCAEPPGPVAP